MALLKGASPDESRAKVFKHLALKFDLEPDQDYARAGNSPPERAFQVLMTGFDLFLEIARSGVPSDDRRTQKRAAKWLVDDAIYLNGPSGVQMLAVALCTLLARTGGDLDGAITDRTPSVAQNEKLLAAVTDFFPLEKLPGKAFNKAIAEYEVLETKRPRPTVVTGAEPAAPYSESIMRGEDPDQNPALVQEQRLWARDFFIGEMTLGGCRLILGSDFDRLESEMVSISELGPGATELRERLLGVWVRGSQVYRDYALLDEA